MAGRTTNPATLLGMSTIQRMFDQYVTVKRMKDVGSLGRRSQATATVEGHIQSLSASSRQALGIIDERAWIAWFDVDTDINEDDTIYDENGKRYNVREITKKAYGINQHLEVILMEQNP